MPNTYYCLKDQKKWEKIRELFPWATEEILTNCVKKWKESTLNKISFEDPNFATIVTERISLDPSEIEEKETLLLNTWYSVDKFDGNPKGFIVLEQDSLETIYVFQVNRHKLIKNCIKFMYINKE